MNPGWYRHATHVVAHRYDVDLRLSGYATPFCGGFGEPVHDLVPAADPHWKCPVCERLAAPGVVRMRATSSGNGVTENNT